MDDLDQKIEVLEKKLDDLKNSIDKIRKVFLWTLIISLALIVLPLVGLAFVIPKLLSTYSNYSNLLKGF